MRVFIINPERMATEKEARFTEKLVEQLEKDGHEVWWSKRDNPDDIGPVERSTINVGKVMDSDKIYVVYPEFISSEGSIFEYGWLWSLYHFVDMVYDEPLVYFPQIIFANKDWFKDSNDGFAQILRYLEEKTKKL